MSTFLEKVAANRLGKEVLKKWLKQEKSPVAKSFNRKVVDSLMGPSVHANASKPDRIKFLARGGNEATGKATMPFVTKNISQKHTPKVSSPEAKLESKVISNQKFGTKSPGLKAKPVAQEPSKTSNKYLNKALPIAAGAGLGLLAGHGAYRVMTRDSKNSHK